MPAIEVFRLNQPRVRLNYGSAGNPKIKARGMPWELMQLLSPFVPLFRDSSTSTVISAALFMFEEQFGVSLIALRPLSKKATLDRTHCKLGFVAISHQVLNIAA